MNFRNPRVHEPEINLIAFIDVLLVVVIFLVLSTTYARYTELQIQLPSAEGSPQQQQSEEVLVSIGSTGEYVVAGTRIDGKDYFGLEGAIRSAVAGKPNAVLILNADAAASHQSVITAMDLSRRAGVYRITFAAQSSASITKIRNAPTTIPAPSPPAASNAQATTANTSAESGVAAPPVAPNP